MDKNLKHWWIRGLTVIALGAGGCDVLDDLLSDEGEAEGEVVDVSLEEFSVTPEPTSAPAGTITFHVTNDGTEIHEFLVVMTDLADDALPTNGDGSYEEDGAGTVLIDEIPTIYPLLSRNLTLDLEAGNYVLLCNMVDKAEGAHYTLGMHAPFTVE